MNTFLTVASLYCILIPLMWPLLTVCNILICLHYPKIYVLAPHPVDSCHYFFIFGFKYYNIVIYCHGKWTLQFFKSFIYFLGQVILSFKHRLSNACKFFTPLSTDTISVSNSNISSQIYFIKVKKDCRCK